MGTNNLGYHDYRFRNFFGFMGSGSICVGAVNGFNDGPRDGIGAGNDIGAKGGMGGSNICDGFGSRAGIGGSTISAGFPDGIGAGDGINTGDVIAIGFCDIIDIEDVVGDRVVGFLHGFRVGFSDGIGAGDDIGTGVGNDGLVLLVVLGASIIFKPIPRSMTARTPMHDAIAMQRRCLFKNTWVNPFDVIFLIASGLLCSAMAPEFNTSVLAW